MLPTQAVIRAITLTFRANGSLRTAFPDFTNSAGQKVPSFFQDLAPEGATLPYLIYSVVASPGTTFYGRLGFTEPSIRLTAYAGDSDSVMTLMGAVVAVFDELNLTLPAGNTQLLTDRLGDPTPYLDSRETSGGGQEIWAATCVYHYAAS